MKDRTTLKRPLFAIGAIAVIVAVIFIGLRLTRSEESPEVVSNESVATTEKPSETDSPEVIGTTITGATSEYGEILWGPNRQAIYIWESEPSSTPQCYDDCAVDWPPVLTTGEPDAGAGIDANLLGTTERSDGTTQVTYNGHPLYYYAHEGSGEVKCHNVATHGGLWWVITTDGVRGA